MPDVGMEVYAAFRPAAARWFYPSFERHNIGMYASVTYIEFAYTRRVIDGSMSFRQYFRNMQSRPSEDGAFVGLGVGVLGIAWHRRNVEYRNWSMRAEVGYEFRAVSDAVISVRVEARRMKAGPVNLNGAGVVFTVGWRSD